MSPKTFYKDISDSPIGERVHRRIRSDIIWNKLALGTWLRLRQLNETENVSVTTLREMLNRLVVEGFVIAEGQRGFEVGPVSESDLRDTCDLRLLLERHSLARSTGKLMPCRLITSSRLSRLSS